MRFDIITIFPKSLESYLNASMIKRARAKKLVDIRVYDLRKFSRDKHKKVDDRPYGGGPGMVLKIEPIIKAVNNILRATMGSREAPFPPKGSSRQARTIKIILFSAGGKQFDAKMARDFAKKYDHIIMIAGHYEGIDERIGKIVFENWKLKIENLSVGPYVLTGGELPVMIVVDAVSRHIPGFLGKVESLEEKRYGVGLSVYTRPEIFLYRGRKYKVPKVLLSGDHKKIDEWRKEKKR